MLIIRSKLYYTASGIITPVGGRPVHSPLPTRAPDGHLQVRRYQMLYNTSLTSKHVDAYVKNQLIIKQEFVH